MVHHYYEHRGAINHAPSIAVQRTLASSHLCHFLRAQPRPLLDFYGTVDTTLHSLSSPLPGSPQTSPPEPFPRHLSSWACNSGEYDCVSMCTGMGTWPSNIGVGSLVDSGRSGLDHLLSLDLCHVSSRCFNCPRRVMAVTIEACLLILL